MGDPLLQAFILCHKGMSRQKSCQASIAFCKSQQHHGDLVGLLSTVVFVSRDLIDQVKHGGLDEIKQTLEHLCLAGEMSIKRGFG